MAVKAVNMMGKTTEQNNDEFKHTQSCFFYFTGLIGDWNS